MVEKIVLTQDEVKCIVLDFVHRHMYGMLHRFRDKPRQLEVTFDGTSKTYSMTIIYGDHD